MDAWNPAQYERFKAERAQPFWDLSLLIDFAGAGRMLDVGCGTGELTRELHDRERLPYTLGIDSSAKMLASAKPAQGLEFKHVAAEQFSPDKPFDIVISNAALQWTDGHRSLLPKILGWVRPGGQIAIQMPANFDHLSHTLANELGERYGLKPRPAPVLPMEDYAQLLIDCGVTEMNIFTKLYPHPMPASESVVEWVKGTYLTHFEKQMEPVRFKEFLRDYAGEFVDRAGDGPYLYTFKRLFIYARV
jgi:trans-aconitate 2-methyltransferase